MSNVIRVAVIGAGNMGRHHIRNYSEIPETELVAISDPNPATQEIADKYGVSYFDNYVEMFNSCDIDAVSIVVPTPLHYQIASEAISRSIHILVEKPIASNAVEAEKLIEQAQQAEVIFTVGHIERYNPVVKALKQLVDSGSLGDISSIISKRLGGFPMNQPKTDVIMDLAIHDIDIFNFLIGQTSSFIGVHGSRTFHSEEMDSAEILLSCNGVSGFMQANWVTPVKIRRISITGSKGFVEADYITQEVVHYDANVSEGLGTFEEFVNQFSNPEKITVEVAKEEPLKQELTAFAAAINGDASRLLVDPHNALAALEIAMLASEKLKNVELAHE